MHALKTRAGVYSHVASVLTRKNTTRIRQNVVFVGRARKRGSVVATAS